MAVKVSGLIVLVAPKRWQKLANAFGQTASERALVPVMDVVSLVVGLFVGWVALFML